MWDATSGEPVTPWMPHRGAVTCGVFAPDGRTVVTGGRDNVVMVWNAVDGKQVGEAMTHPRAVVGVEFAQSGDRLATICDDHAGADLGRGDGARRDRPAAAAPGADQLGGLQPGRGTAGHRRQRRSARVWDARTGAAVGLPLEHPDHVMGASFSGDGKLVATACRDATVQVGASTRARARGSAGAGCGPGPKIQHRGRWRGVVSRTDDRHVVSVLHDWGVFVWACPSGRRAASKRGRT